jgi:hypothetical protein
MVNAAGAGAGDKHKAKKAAKAVVPFFSPAALQQGAQLVFVRRGAARRGAARNIAATTRSFNVADSGADSEATARVCT